MKLEFTCNKRHKNFSWVDIKKSDLELNILELEENEVVSKAQLTYVEEKDDKEENILITTAIFRKGKVTFDKRYFEEKKEKYNVILLDGENNVVGTLPLEFKNKRLLLILLFPILMISLIGGMYLLNPSTPTNSTDVPKHPTIQEGNGQVGEGEFSTDLEAIKEALNAQTKYLNIRISAYVDVVDNEGTFKIYNSNEDMNIQVIVYAYDKANKQIKSDITYYVSPLLKTNENLQKGELTTSLEPGKYNAIAMFNTYDTEGNFLGQAGQEIILNIK